MSNERSNSKIGEVVEVLSLNQIKIQQVDKMDEVSLGKFVVVEPKNLIGVLGDISIKNPHLESYPRPKKISPVPIKSLFPDLLEQYPTIITVFVLGYIESTEYFQAVPTRPPQIYDQVRFATVEEIKNFHQSEENEIPQLNYLIQLQAFEQSAIIDALIRIIIQQIGAIFHIDAEEILGVMS